MDNRNNRETEGRTETVRKTEWAPAALLPEFTQQAGWAYRWIRISLANTADNLNVSSKMREGWEPVKHMPLFSDKKSSTSFGRGGK